VPSETSFLNGSIEKGITINMQRMLGGNHALKLNQDYGASNDLWYMPIN
jgi:hypothetical protein